MAESITTTVTTPTTKPQLKLTIPLITESKAKSEGLFMADPGDEYDKRWSRQEIVRGMLRIGQRDGVLRRMKNWRNQPVFDDDDDDKVMAKVNNAEKTNTVDETREVHPRDGVDNRRTDSALHVREESPKKKVKKGEDKGVTCTSKTSPPSSPLSTWAEVCLEVEKKKEQRKKEKKGKQKRKLDEFDDPWTAAGGAK